MPVATSPLRPALQQPQNYRLRVAQQDKMGGGGKIPYPKHVWSPAGGWYSQPANWKANTLVAGVVLFSITALVFNTSANLEYRDKMPEEGRFFPSRYWSKQIRQHEREKKAAGES